MSLTQEQLERLRENAGNIAQIPGEKVSQAESNLRNSTHINPDQYGQDVEISKKLGVSPDLVSEDRDSARAESYLTDDQWGRLKEGAKTRKWLQNPDNARLAYDDVPNLVDIERAQDRPWYDIGSDMFKGQGDSMMIGMGKMEDQAMIGMLEESKQMLTDENTIRFTDPDVLDVEADAAPGYRLDPGRRRARGTDRQHRRRDRATQAEPAVRRPADR